MSKKNEHPQKPKYGYDIVSNLSAYPWKVPKQLRAIDSDQTTCPYCERNLYNETSIIPISRDKGVSIRGKRCLTCNVLYISEPKKIINLLRDNTYARGFTFEGTDYSNWSEVRKRIALEKQKKQRRNEYVSVLNRIPSAAVLLETVNRNSAVTLYIIVNNIADIDQNKYCLHYSDSNARELLAAAFEEKKHRTATIDEERLTISEIIYPTQGDSLLNEFLQKCLNIKNGGGSSLYIHNKREIIVDLLLYSPFSERYEIAHATYNKNTDECYMDIGIYRNFVSKHGNPGVVLCFGSGNTKYYSNDWNELRNESLLKCYGYSVSEKDNLSSLERRKILAEIVDLELMPAWYIMRMLDFFCASHPTDKDISARCKWQNDKEFTSNYKVNPERFLIAKRPN